MKVDSCSFIVLLLFLGLSCRLYPGKNHKLSFSKLFRNLIFHLIGAFVECFRKCAASFEFLSSQQRTIFFQNNDIFLIRNETNCKTLLFRHFQRSLTFNGFITLRPSAPLTFRHQCIPNTLQTPPKDILVRIVRVSGTTDEQYHQANQKQKNGENDKLQLNDFGFHSANEFGAIASVVDRNFPLVTANTSEFTIHAPVQSLRVTPMGKYHELFPVPNGLLLAFFTQKLWKMRKSSRQHKTNPVNNDWWFVVILNTPDAL